MRSEKALRRVGQSHLCFCWECSPWSDLSLSLQWGTPNSCSSPCSEGSWPWPWVAGLVCTVKVDKAIAALVRKILLQQEPRVAVMCHLPALQRSSFSFPMGSGDAGEANNTHAVASALQICCCRPCICTSSRQGSVQLACVFGRLFPDACKMPFFFSKSPSSTTLSGRADPWHPESPYGSITFLPA